MNLPRKISGAALQCSILLTLFVSAAPIRANDLDAGKEKAMSCAMCHGASGISQMPGTPHLAGQPAIYVVEQLKNFRSGQRTNQIMNVIAKPLTDTEINNLALWFESIKIQVQP